MKKPWISCRHVSGSFSPHCLPPADPEHESSSSVRIHPVDRLAHSSAHFCPNMLLALSTQLCPHRCHSSGIQVPFPPTRQVQGRISNKDSASPCCVLLCGKAFEGFFVLLSPWSRGFGLVACLQIHRIRSLAEIWCSAQRALMTCCRRTLSSLPKSRLFVAYTGSA